MELSLRKQRIRYSIIFAIAFFHIGGGLVYSQNVLGDSWDKVRKSGQGKLQLVYFPAGQYVSGANNEGKGICVEIMKDFQAWLRTNKKVNLEVTLLSQPSFLEAYLLIKNSKEGVIGLGNFTITKHRETEVQFLKPFLSNVAILASHRGKSVAKDNKDEEPFKNMTLYVGKGTMNLERAKNKIFRGAKVVICDNDEEFRKFSSDPNGLAYFDLATFMFLNRSGKYTRQSIGDDMNEKFAFITSLNGSWKEIFSEFAGSDGGYYNSAKYKEILVRYLGQTGIGLFELSKSCECNCN